MSNQWQQSGGRRGSERMIMWLCILLGVALAAAVAVIAVRHWLPKQSAEDEKIEKTIVTATPVTGITILDAEDPTTVLQMEPGERRTLQASLEPADASATIRWSSGDESIATVDSSGTVSCVSPGRVVITAAVGDLTAQVMIEVAETQKNNNGGSVQTPEPQTGTRVDTVLGAHFTVPAGFYEIPVHTEDGLAYQYENGTLQMTIYVYEIGAAFHPGGDTARQILTYEYGLAHRGDEVTFESVKPNKWVISGYEDGGATIFYNSRVASDDNEVVYFIEFRYPSSNADTCNPMVGTFMKGFSYDR